MYETLNFIWDGSSLLVKDNGGYEKRNESTIKLFKEGLKIYLKHKKIPFKLNISTSDKIIPGYYSFSNNENKNLIPDYVFDKWEAVHIFNYDKKADEILEASKRKILSDKIFWIGNTNTHFTRKILINNFNNNKKVLFLDSGDWKKSDKTDIDGSLITCGPYISLEDHANYKYLLDIRGNGYSGRFKLLMFLGRPIFYVERSDNEYFFYDDLKPFVHYIPVKSDLSDLEEKIEWAETNEKDCKNISKTAQEYAINNLKTKNAIQYFSKILLSLGI
jgi:hypothetical protein